jgi:anti-sigma regulatory factor (Ser/Thr protein kinase)
LTRKSGIEAHRIVAQSEIPNNDQFLLCPGREGEEVMARSGFRHEALIYADAEEFLAGTVPFLRGALEAGEPALVAVSQARTGLLEGELGADAAEIRFADMETLGRNPARIIPFWREFLDEHGDRPVAGIGEPVWPGRERHEIDECQRHEALLNVAFERSPPAWSLLCPYDGAALADDVLEQIDASHPHVAREGLISASADYAERVDCFGGELTGRPPLMDAFHFRRDGLAQVRRRVEGAAVLVGIGTRSIIDLVLATSELAANSVVHGGGGGTLRIWRDGERLVVEVEDRGLVEEPLVGRLRPGPTQTGGRGLWLANQLCDLVQIRSGAQGTTVRLHSALD